jgi:hypothetical protein
VVLLLQQPRWSRHASTTQPPSPPPRLHPPHGRLCRDDGSGGSS